MKTDDLITMLANDAGPAPKNLPTRSLRPALFIGPIAAALIATTVLGLIPAQMWLEKAVWSKLAYSLALACIASLTLIRLGQPGAPRSKAFKVLPWVFVLVALIGLLNYLNTPVSLQHKALFGGSYLVCPWAILTTSLPGFLLSIWAAKQLAPTQLRLTGAVCGLLAGSLGAMGYALACTETSLTFISIWYTAGMALTTLLGMLIGPRLLRW